MIVNTPFLNFFSVFLRFMYLWASGSARTFSLREWGLLNGEDVFSAGVGIAELKPTTLLHDCVVAFFNSVAEERDRDNHELISFFCMFQFGDGRRKKKKTRLFQ